MVHPLVRFRISLTNSIYACNTFDISCCCCCIFGDSEVNRQCNLTISNREYIDRDRQSCSDIECLRFFFFNKRQPRYRFRWNSCARTTHVDRLRWRVARAVAGCLILVPYRESLSLNLHSGSSETHRIRCIAFT